MKLNRKDLFNFIVIVLILADVILLLITTFYKLPNRIGSLIIEFDLLVCVILFSEFCYRFYKAENKKEFFKHNWLDLIASIPFDFFLLRCLRFIRFVRILKLIRVGRVLLLFRKDLKLFTKFLKSTKLDKVLSIVIFLILASSVVLAIVDSNTPTLFSSFWYVIVTLTTVGYGDITPSSDIGKIVGVFLILVGIVMFSILTGAISSIYTSKIQSESDDKLEKDIKELKEQVEKLTKIIEDK